MGRWEPDSQGRLGAAALELFAERGFEATTVADIAARAGLTERTFFRHFADKREILFGGSAALADLMVGAVMAAPPSAGPFEAVTGGLDAAADLLGERHDFARQRHAIISATPELQERELIKLASLATTLSGALAARDVAPVSASLVAEMAIAVFRIAFERWVDADSEQTLAELIHDSLDELRGLTVLTSEVRAARR